MGLFRPGFETARRWACLAVAAGLALCSGACTPVNPLAATIVPGPVTCACPDNDEPVVQAHLLDSRVFKAGVLQSSAWSCTLDNLATGAVPPITGATLTVPGGAVIQLLPGTSRGVVNYGVGWTYQPGGTYTVKCTVGAVHYVGAVVAPGGVVIPPLSAPGSITWPYAGDCVDLVEIYADGSDVTYDGAASSGSVSETNASYFPIAGTYTASVLLMSESGDCLFGVSASEVDTDVDAN